MIPARTHTEDLTPPPLQRSQGTGRLCVESLEGKTRLAKLYQQGCAKLRIPNQHEGKSLEAIMINTSGGMTGGDRIEWNFEAGANTRLTLTTQANEKIYKSSHGLAQTTITLKIGQKARFAWLPQETILFNRSALQRRIEADLEPEAEALFVEAVIFGRTAMGETIKDAIFEARLNDQWRIRRGGRILHAEAFCISGQISDLLKRQAIMGGAAAMATVLLVSPRARTFLDEIRQEIGLNGASSAWEGKLLARIVSQNGYDLRKTLVPLIERLMPVQSVPRVWSL